MTADSVIHVADSGVIMPLTSGTQDHDSLNQVIAIHEPLIMPLTSGNSDSFTDSPKGGVPE